MFMIGRTKPARVDQLSSLDALVYRLLKAVEYITRVPAVFHRQRGEDRRAAWT